MILGSIQDAQLKTTWNFQRNFHVDKTVEFPVEFHRNKTVELFVEFPVAVKIDLWVMELTLYCDLRFL